MAEIKKRIRLFLSRFFKDFEFQDDEDIFSLGFVNSLFAMQLVTFLENEFRLKIDNNELDLDNFRTINKIACLIAHKGVVNP